jgi:hypothetical protein
MEKTKEEVREAVEKEKIEKAIINKVKEAANFDFLKSEGRIAEGTAYYVEFTSTKVQPDDCYFYAFVDKDDCRLYNDGFELVNSVQVHYERNRSLIQRFRDFELPDVMAAVIGLLVTITLVYIVVKDGGTTNISKEFLAVFTLVLGYYFGRNQPRT